MSNKNEVFEYLIDQLRQQVNNNQCEDLAHEVQSLKNQLRDASAQIKELTCALDCAENEVMCLRSVVDLDPKGAIGYIRRANSAMTDTMRHQYLSKALEELGCKDAPEQSGCCEEDVRECEHDFVNSEHKYLALVKATGDEEAYKLVPKGGYISGGYISAGQHYVVGEHGPEQSGCRKEDAQECAHDWLHSKHKSGFVCFNCGARKS